MDSISPFRIELPTRGYDDIFSQMINAVPPGTFYDFSRPVVMWSSKPTSFVLVTDQPGIPVKIDVIRTGPYHPAVNQGNILLDRGGIPLNPQTVFRSTLGQGLNRIIVTEQSSPNKIQNGDFVDASGWDLGPGWAIVTGSAAWNCAAGSGSLSQTLTGVLPNSQYRLIFKFVNNPAYCGTITARLGDYSSYEIRFVDTDVHVVSLPVQTTESGTLTFSLEGNASGPGTILIDSVSLTSSVETPSITGRKTILDVIASTNTLFFESFGREISRSTKIIDSQHDAIYSPYAIRLLDQVVTFQDLLPTVPSLKILSTKLLTRAKVHFPAREIGTEDLIKAFTFNTPVYARQRTPNQKDLDVLGVRGNQIERMKLFRVSENKGGRDAHIWFPNKTATRWAAFWRMLAAQKTSIEEITDTLIVTQGDEHFFDYDSTGADFLSNLSQTDCFDYPVTITTCIHSDYVFCAWGYDFDRIVPLASPIGEARISFDSGVPFDRGLPFDTDAVDPWSDGWVGWSLTNRFDGGINLDSMVSPQRNVRNLIFPTCVNTGPVTQTFNSHRMDIDISAPIGATGSVDNYVSGPMTNLAISFPPDVQVGVPFTAIVKTVDVNGMTDANQNGNITLFGGGLAPIPLSITNGQASFTMTPTATLPIWAILHPFALPSPFTVFHSVKPGPAVDFFVDIGTLAGNTVPLNTTVPVSISAVDAYNNIAEFNSFIARDVKIWAQSPTFQNNGNTPTNFYYNDQYQYLPIPAPYNKILAPNVFSTTLDKIGTGVFQVGLQQFPQKETASFTVV